MEKYVKDFQLNENMQTVFNTIYQYLISEGYKYIQSENENVFKKGKGIWTIPSLFKISFIGSMVRLEAWKDQSLWTGRVALARRMTIGFLGAEVAEAASEKSLKKRITQIEVILARYTNHQTDNTYTSQSQAASQALYTRPIAVNQQEGDSFCINCGAKLVQGASFCTNCGQIVTGAVPSQFREDPSLIVQYPMKWFKFLIYFVLCISALLNLSSGIEHITGNIYFTQTEGRVTADMVYAVYGSLKYLDVFWGIVLVLFAGFAIYTRGRLAKYKANGPMCLYIFYVAGAGLSLVYSVLFFVITGIFNSALSVFYIIFQVVAFVLNYIYFTKRKTLFVN